MVWFTQHHRMYSICSPKAGIADVRNLHSFLRRASQKWRELNNFVWQVSQLWRNLYGFLGRLSRESCELCSFLRRVSQNWPVQLAASGDIWNYLEPPGSICDPAVGFRESEISLQTRIKSANITSTYCLPCNLEPSIWSHLEPSEAIWLNAWSWSS